MIFHKTPTSVIGPEDDIVRPTEVQRLDAEGEMVVVIKDTCRNVSKEDALNHVFGYTCGNDVSAATGNGKTATRTTRDWWRAKSADTFSPMGPWIETEIDPHAQHLRTRVNGNEEQNETTNHLLFDVPTMIEVHHPLRNPGARGLHLHRHPRHHARHGRRLHLRDRHQRHRRPPQYRQAGAVAGSGQPHPTQGVGVAGHYLVNPRRQTVKIVGCRRD